MTTSAEVKPDLDSSELLIPAPELIVRFSLTSDQDLQIAWGGGSDREVFHTDSAELAMWVLSLDGPRRYSQLVDDAIVELGLDTDSARELIGTFVDFGMFQPEPATRPAGEELWMRLGWHDALFYHRAARRMRWRHEYPEGATVYTWFHKDKLVQPDSERPASLDPAHPGEIALPPPTDRVIEADISQVMARRRTSRRFAGTSIEIEDISDILYWGLTPIVPGATRQYLTTRGMADGAREREEPTYVSAHLVFDSEAIPDEWSTSATVFRYSPARRSLIPIPGDGIAPFSDLLWGQSFADGAPVMIVLSINWLQYMWKYRASSYYKMAHYDVGGIMQTILYVATAIGLRTFITPAIDDHKFTDLLAISDPLLEGPTYIAAVGRL